LYSEATKPQLRA